MRVKSFFSLCISLSFAIDCSHDQTIQSLNGSCNNLQNPLFGSIGIPFLRSIAPATYDDGVYSLPRSNSSYPSPRLVSNALFGVTQEALNSSLLHGQRSLLFMAFGQYIATEISFVSPSTAIPLNCTVPIGDPYFDPLSSGNKFISAFRSKAILNSNNGYFDQINDMTSFIDGSNIYGTSDVRLTILREYNGGRMLLNPLTDCLPVCPAQNQPRPIGGGCPYFTESRLSGNLRVDSNPLYTAITTLFVREHNRYAKQYFSGNPMALDEEIFQAARRWTISLLQQIIVYEYGSFSFGPLPSYAGYNSNINPGIENFFSAAAFRYGHSEIPSTLPFLSSIHQFMAESSPLRDVYHFSAYIEGQVDTENRFDALLRGGLLTSTLPVDASFSTEVRNFVYAKNGMPSTDLPATNILRGRDHGLPSYNDARRAYGLAPVTSLANITKNTGVQAILASLYATVEDIDPYVGGISEDPKGVFVVGELFLASLKEQFQRIRDGDRFWFENAGVLNASLLAEVKATKFLDVIIRNTGLQRQEFGDLTAFVINRAVNDKSNSTSRCIRNRVLDSSHSFSWNIDAVNAIVVFNITFDQGGFMGLGISNPGSTMIGADIMLFEDDGNGNIKASDCHASDYVRPVPDPLNSQDITLISSSYASNSVTVSFSRPLAAKGPYDLPFDETTSQLISAWGVGGIAYHGSNSIKLAPLCPIQGSGYFDYTDIDIVQLRIFHGVLMGMTWGVTLTVGAFIARYERHTPWWIGAHRIMQFISTVITFPAYFVATTMVSSRLSSPHALLGTILIAGATFQSTVGTFFYVMSKFRKVNHQFLNNRKELDIHLSKQGRIGRLSFQAHTTVTDFGIDKCAKNFHTVFGKMLILAAFVQIYLGLVMIKAGNILYVIFASWAGYLLFLFVYKEVEYQFNLPKGIFSKLGLVLNFFSYYIIYCCCCGKKHDNNNGSKVKSAENELDVINEVDTVEKDEEEKNEVEKDPNEEREIEGKRKGKKSSTNKEDALIGGEEVIMNKTFIGDKKRQRSGTSVVPPLETSTSYREINPLHNLKN